MIRMKDFVDLGIAIPKSYIKEPKDGLSYILDQNKERIGSIHWETGIVSIFEEYEYCDKVLEQIGNYVDRTRVDYELGRY